MTSASEAVRKPPVPRRSAAAGAAAITAQSARLPSPSGNASAAARAPPLTLPELLELAGENNLADVKDLALRNRSLDCAAVQVLLCCPARSSHTGSCGDGISSDNPDSASAPSSVVLQPLQPLLPALEVLSVSHNQLSSVSCLSPLTSLVTLNLNFNALTTLEGVGSLVNLRQLYASSNRIRDLEPLQPCSQLRTLHLFRNELTELDGVVQVLSGFKRLAELELGGNACGTDPRYKAALISYIPSLESLDGAILTDLDFELSAGDPASYSLRPTSHVQLLVVEHPGEAAQQVESASTASATVSQAVLQPPDPGGRQMVGGSSSRATCASHDTDGGLHGSAPSPVHQPGSSGVTILGLPPPPQQRPGSAAGLSRRSSPAGNGSSTTAMCLGGSSSYGGWAVGSCSNGLGVGNGPSRPGTAAGGGTSCQLYGNEFLNDHPILLEYLVKQVLADGSSSLAKAAASGETGGAVASLGGDASGAPAKLSRGASSFVARLRDTAAVMAAREGSSTQSLATQKDLLPPSASAVARAAAAEALVSAATPHDTIRQLVRLCEGLIKEVEALRMGAAQVSSAGGGGSSSSGGRPGTAAGQRPHTPGARQAGTPIAESNSGSDGSSAAQAGQAEVEQLRKQVKALQLENQNVYWLADEVKRLRSEAAGRLQDDRVS